MKRWTKKYHNIGDTVNLYLAGELGLVTPCRIVGRLIHNDTAYYVVTIPEGFLRLIKHDEVVV